jgi:PAS domain S-box-containing protein
VRRGEGHAGRAAFSAACEDPPVPPAATDPELLARSAQRIGADVERLGAPPYTTGARGITRHAYTPEYAATVDFFAGKLGGLGFDIHFDPVGTLVARNVPRGKRALGIGSHCDANRGGGKWDGTLGCVVALEVCRLAAERGLELPLQILAFLEEEGSGFGQMLLGSRIMAGRIEQAELDALAGEDGTPFLDAARAAGYPADRWRDSGQELDGLAAWLEVHIEQGRVLQDTATQLGVVDRIAGYVHADLSIAGRADHAGATPMGFRSDAGLTGAEITLELERLTVAAAPDAVGTGRALRARPGAHQRHPRARGPHGGRPLGVRRPRRRLRAARRLRPRARGLPRAAAHGPRARPGRAPAPVDGGGRPGRAGGRRGGRLRAADGLRRGARHAARRGRRRAVGDALRALPRRDLAFARRARRAGRRGPRRARVPRRPRAPGRRAARLSALTPDSGFALGRPAGEDARIERAAPTLPPSVEPRLLTEALGQLAEAVTVHDAGGRLLYVNDAAVRLMGFGSAEELLAAPAGALMANARVFHPDGRRLESADLPGRRVLAGEEAAPLLVRWIAPDGGGLRWSLIKARALRDEQGDPVAAVNVIEDVTDVKEAELSQRLLAEAASVLASSMDHRTTLEHVAELAVPHLADWCALDLVDEHGRIEQVAVAHIDPERVRWGRELRRRYPVDPARDSGIPQVIRTGEVQLTQDITDELLSAVAEDPEHLALLREVGFRSVLIVPLLAGGRTTGRSASC